MIDYLQLNIDYFKAVKNRKLSMENSKLRGVLVVRSCKMKKAFTLIELTVAVGLLALVIAFASVIFNVSINAYRVASANAEVMQKARAITDQLNSDFKGLRKDALFLIWFEQPDPNDPSQRYDQIMFFADGDFQSTQLYSIPTGYSRKIPNLDGTDAVTGSVARVYYGQAQVNGILPQNQIGQAAGQRTLARRQHILTADSSLFLFPDIANFTTTGFSPANNDGFEHDSNSLSQWKVLCNTQLNNDTVILTCFGNRPAINFQVSPPVGLHMLISQGIVSFSIQWAYWDPGLDLVSPLDDRLFWFPSGDPDGDGTYTDSHFTVVASQFSLPPNQFGVYFKLPGLTSVSGWLPVENGAVQYRTTPSIQTFPNGFFPKALKFTFRVCDSKGLIEEFTPNGQKIKGKTFTHIVYLED
jgi:prepilin-type N-terminal cleavage/methylation domain-containing protein